MHKYIATRYIESTTEDKPKNNVGFVSSYVARMSSLRVVFRCFYFEKVLLLNPMPGR